MKKNWKTKECVIKKFFKTKKNLPMICIGWLILAFAVYALVAPSAFKWITDNMFGNAIHLRSQTRSVNTNMHFYDDVHSLKCMDGYALNFNRSCSNNMDEMDRMDEAIEECENHNWIGLIEFHEHDRCEMQADLIIKDVLYNVELENIYWNPQFNKPVLKFTITIKNQGNAIAVSSYDTIGLWIKINGNDYGREAIDFEDGLWVNEEIIIEFSYADDNNNRFLHDTWNLISFYVDKTYIDSQFNWIGFVEESNENNNEFIREIHVEWCYDKEDWSSWDTFWALELYWIEVDDSCSKDWNVLEYRCEDDFVLWYGHRNCNDWCSNGACVSSNTGPISTERKLR